MKQPLFLLCLFICFSCEQKPAAPSPSQQTAVQGASLPKKETANPYVAVDVSPMDMAYFPADFPLQKMNGRAPGLPVARVIYSRPHRGGRSLFGNLVQWGQPWRLGANEATEIEFFQAVSVQKKRIDKGSYVLYAIPYQDRWTVVLNKNLYSWGLRFDPRDDAARFDVPVTNKPQIVEHFTMTFEKTATGADLIMVWENTEVRLPFQF